MTAARVAVAGALTLLAIVVVVLLSQSAPRMAGTNSVLLGSYISTVAPGQRLCQRGELVPPDTASLRIFIGVYGHPGGPYELTIRSGRQLVGSGQVGAGQRDGYLTVPVARVTRAVPDATVCIANRGPGPLALAGLAGPPTPSTTIGQTEQTGTVQISYMRRGSESWWSLIPTIAQRFGVAKADLLGSWTFWGAIVALLGAWGLGLSAILRRSWR